MKNGFGFYQQSILKTRRRIYSQKGKTSSLRNFNPLFSVQSIAFSTIKPFYTMDGIRNHYNFIACFERILTAKERIQMLKITIQNVFRGKVVPSRPEHRRSIPSVSVTIATRFLSIPSCHR